MSTNRYVTVSCDCAPCPLKNGPCGEESDPEMTAGAIRKRLRAARAWKLSKDRDLCPGCVAHGTGGSNERS